MAPEDAVPEAGTYTLALTGDVMLGRLVNETIAEQGFAYPWGDVLPALRAADLLLINLECALTARLDRWRDREGREKAFYFRAEPRVVETLGLAGVDFASLANNHACDFGDEGMLETIRMLDDAGVAHAGAGATLAEARRPARLRCGDLRVAVVAFADHPAAWRAGEDTPGCNYTPVSLEPRDFALVREPIGAAREGADLVVCSMHWGPNMRARPSAAFRAFAHAVIDAGADVFWGHSAHVVQGVEVYRGRPILYDTGDFVDDYIVDAELRNDRSALFLLRVAAGRITELELLPVAIGDCQVNPAAGAAREWFVHRFRERSREFGAAVAVEGDRVAVPVAGDAPRAEP
jgi:poly-gamma-glutamate synthesis protein (capsule biosynthesis protein)